MKERDVTTDTTEMQRIQRDYCEQLCYVQSLSHVWLFAAPWTVAYQASLSMEFPRQEYWNGLPFPTPGDLPNPEIETTSLALAGSLFTIAPHYSPANWTTRNKLINIQPINTES